MNGLGRETLAAEYARRRTPELRDAAVEAYLPAARSVARKFTGRGVDEDDLFQVASLAMVKALGSIACTVSKEKSGGVKEGSLLEMV